MDCGGTHRRHETGGRQGWAAGAGAVLRRHLHLGCSCAQTHTHARGMAQVATTVCSITMIGGAPGARTPRTAGGTRGAGLAARALTTPRHKPRLAPASERGWSQVPAASGAGCVPRPRFSPRPRSRSRSGSREGSASERSGRSVGRLSPSAARPPAPHDALRGRETAVAPAAGGSLRLSGRAAGSTWLS